MKKYGVILIQMFLIIFIMATLSHLINPFIGKVYVSYGSDKSNCMTSSVSLDDEDIIYKYHMYDYVKIDKIISTKKVNSRSLRNIILQAPSNAFPYGIILNDKIVLLSEEINANNIINYESATINVRNLNAYLKKKHIKDEFNKIDEVTLFLTESKYLDDFVWTKLTLVNGFHRQKTDLLLSNLLRHINNSAQLLSSMNQENGEYIYGLRSNSGELIGSYNILRHAGSTWSLINNYKLNPNMNLKQTIQNSIKYLLDNYVVTYNDDISFVIEKKTDEIKLGGSALALLMLSDYYLVFNDSTYNDIALKLANGLIYMQNNDGSYNHVLSTDFHIKEKYRTVFYDGEATFALLRFYKISNNKKYLEHAKMAIDMFINQHYEIYCDQWISYAMLEFLPYYLDEKYIKFTLDNYTSNISKFDNVTSFVPTKLELLMNVYKTYKYLLEHNVSSTFLKDFDLTKLNNSIDINIHTLLNYYIDEEMAMYFSKPYLVLYGFSAFRDNFRMRIDDIQHSIMGLMSYYDINKD